MAVAWSAQHSQEEIRETLPPNVVFAHLVPNRQVAQELDAATQSLATEGGGRRAELNKGHMVKGEGLKMNNQSGHTFKPAFQIGCFKKQQKFNGNVDEAKISRGTIR